MAERIGGAQLGATKGIPDPPTLNDVITQLEEQVSITASVVETVQGALFGPRTPNPTGTGSDKPPPACAMLRLALILKELRQTNGDLQDIGRGI